MIEKVIGNRCTGCEACANACPRRCISMKPDRKGFLVPKVNIDQCIHCKVCVNTCPVLNFIKNHSGIFDKKRSYAFKSFNEIFRKICSSGAASLELSDYFVNNQGVVYGAAFNDVYELKHIGVKSQWELEQLAGSKYLQSKIGNVYSEIKGLLDQNTTVLFVGLTCQVEGLRAFLKKDYENLYCVDLICMGIPSPGVWNRYVNTFFNPSSIAKINFKDKRLGWHKFSVTITNRDGSVVSTPGFDDKYMECMFKGYSLRESCFNCTYKCENKISDITIADCWGCENYVEELDDNRGLSMVIVHSEKGGSLLDILRRRGDVAEFNYPNVLKYNSNYHMCVSPQKGRNLFYFLLRISPRIAFNVMGTNPKRNRFRLLISKIRRG